MPANVTVPRALPSDIGISVVGVSENQFAVAECMPFTETTSTTLRRLSNELQVACGVGSAANDPKTDLGGNDILRCLTFDQKKYSNYVTFGTAGFNGYDCVLEDERYVDDPNSKYDVTNYNHLLQPLGKSRRVEEAVFVSFKILGSITLQKNRCFLLVTKTLLLLLTITFSLLQPHL